MPFYTRKGDREGYMGYQYKHSIRYDFTYGDNVRLGVLGAQDAGEPFLQAGTIWDMISIHFTWCSKSWDG